jgi:hypothetical protein
MYGKKNDGRWVKRKYERKRNKGGFKDKYIRR